MIDPVTARRQRLPPCRIRDPSGQTIGRMKASDGRIKAPDGPLKAPDQSIESVRWSH
jgi:hypothetical protein